MEATALEKGRQKKKSSSRVEDLKGPIPEPPKLEDFVEIEADHDCEENITNENASSPPLSCGSDPATMARVETSSTTSPPNSIGVEAVEDTTPGSDIVSDDTSSIFSVDPCEEALIEANPPLTSVSAPNLDEADYFAHAQLYPSLPLTIDSSLPSMASLTTWENIPTPEHQSKSTSKNRTMVSAMSFEVPVELLPAELDSKVHHLYANMILESSDEKVKEFLKGTKTSYDGFELYELISSYQRAYNQLSGCEKSLSDLRETCMNLEKGLWTVDNDTLSQNSSCVDGNIVSASHKYMVAKFDKQIYVQLDKVLKGTKELVKDSFSLFTYSAQLCKTQINHFFHKSFKDINLQSFDVQGYYSGYPNGELQNCANLLKVCLSTLFIFIRRGSTHAQVRKDCQKWLTDCVGLLLRIATLDDHLFILNHTIRCPPGMVGKGLACCVQVPKIPIPSSPEDYYTSGFSNLNLDYALTVLKIILNPVSKRDEFLKQVEVGLRVIPSHDPTNQWVVVDSDGEDDPEDVSFFKESDLISLLQQIPFDNMFRRILLISKVQNQDIYDIRVASERNVLKLLAFGTQLVNILGQGFVSYYTDRYRQLIKMIGRLVLHCVQYITDHIESLISSDIGSECGQKGSLIRKEYDLFFRNAVGILFSGKNIGSLQFLAAMPFQLISSEMLWHVYCAITKWTVSDRFKTDISSEFENELVSMNESDGFYLLTTLCSMANAREKTDANFTRIVTLHLFQIGFLSPLTRDCCSKTARDLLGNLTRKYPEIITILLHTIDSKMQIIETFSLYLLKELAFDLWIPTDLDMKLIFHWLVSFPVSSTENQTARFVIQSMNWSFNSADGKLFLIFDIHYEVALMIMESNTKWEKGQSFISEGMKQMNPLTSKIQDNWAWDMLKRLHLHAFDRHAYSNQDQLQQILMSMPTFDSNPELECVRKGIESKNPLACFLALYLTPAGVSVPLICSKGIDLIEIILQNYRLEYVIHALFFITPLFIDCPETLHSIDKFRNILTVLLAADMTYVRMAKNLITTDFPGETTKLFGDMISCQVNQCSRFGTDEKSVVAFWTESLTKLNGWNKDNNVLYLLDILAKSSLTRSDCHSYFMRHFADIYKNMPKSSHSGITSLFSWTASATTLLSNPSYSQIPHFTYYLLCIEMELENQTGFWKTLCIKLNNPKVPLDAAIKKSVSVSKFSTSTNFITIYRWGQLALDLPNNHELTFLVWQKFFLRYFHRVSDNQTTQYACVASRFFEGMINSSFYNKLRRKLNDLLSYVKEKLTSFEQNINTSENASENPTVMKELLMDKINLANALVLWITDCQLLQPTLYLPALSPQFMPTVLLSLMDGEEISWNNYIDFEVILSEDRVAARTYMTTIGRSCWFDGFKLPRFCDLRISLSNCVEDVLKRLNSYDGPREPPNVPVFEDVIPTSPPMMLVDVASMKRGLDTHFSQLRNFSKSFAIQISQLLALNCSYCECLPELYLNSPAEMVVNARCSGKSGSRNFESCAGPARIVFKYTEAKLNENLGHKIHQNRIEYQTLLDGKGTQPPPEIVCIAAVFIEDFITNLVVHYRRASSDGEERVKVSGVGSELFYYAATLVNNDTDFYPPTRQLLSSLLEVLGREFISTHPSQCHRLVTTSIRNPKLVGALATHLSLTACQPSMLIDIYKEVASIPRKDVDLAFVILTKFDINNWLRTTKPKLNDRSQLLQIMWKAIVVDGFAPEDDRLMVHDSYRNHFRSMLVYDFPQHYGEILALLLEGIKQNNVSPQVWYDFCNGLSRDTIRFYPGMDSFLRKREAKRFATEGNMLGYHELMGTAQLLAQHFTDERLANGLYGLYSKYRNYVEPLSCFLQIVAYSVVACTLTNSKGTLSQNIVDAVWPIVRNLYSPWMLPYNQKFIQQNCAQWIQHMNFDATNVLQPWISNDSQLAMIIVNDFTDCLMFLAETLPGNTAIFSYLWNFYIENFAFIGVKEHVVGVVHNCLVSVPWASFWPSFSDVELWVRVVEKFLPASHSFLSIVFAQISWLEWIGQLSPKFFGKGHAMLLNLTVRLGNDTVARESPTWMQVLETAETRISWLAIPPSGLEPILNWLVMSIDPRVVLNLDLTHRVDKALLRLLETACGYGHTEQLNTNSSCNSMELNSKRYCFVRSYVKLIVSASSKHKNLLESHPKAFEDAIGSMISELATSVKRENQSPDFFMSHLRELLALMSNHTLVTIARNAVLEWCNSTDSHTLVFLMTVIQLSCGVQVRPYIVCPLLETVINLCFKYPDVTWTSIRDLTVVNPEELSNFFDISSKDGHYLVLHSLLLRRFPIFIQGGLDTICLFMDLLKNIKPKESNEEALSLIYNEILNVMIHIHKEASEDKNSTNEAVLKQGKKFLLQLAQHASLVGDDKQGWGLLGAFGIGKSSQLSVRGRLFAKCIGTFIFAQLPVNLNVRINPGSEGHFSQISNETSIKPHPEVQSCLEKLESLKQKVDLIECIDFATEFINLPDNALSSSSIFISKLNGYLFTSRFLARS